jgi:hypothetical protein
MANTYVIYNKHGSSAAPLVLGVHDSAPTQVVQCTPDASKGAQAWSIHDLRGTCAFFLKHEASGLFVKTGDLGAPVTLAPLDPQDSSFALELTNTSGAFVFIRTGDTGDNFGVTDDSTADGAPVVTVASGSLGDSQEWMFAPTAA